MIGTNMILRGIKKFKNKDIKAKNKQPNKKSNSSYILFEFLKIIFLRINEYPKITVFNRNTKIDAKTIILTLHR